MLCLIKGSRGPTTGNTPPKPSGLHTGESIGCVSAHWQRGLTPLAFLWPQPGLLTHRGHLLGWPRTGTSEIAQLAGSFLSCGFQALHILLPKPARIQRRGLVSALAGGAAEPHWGANNGDIASALSQLPTGDSAYAGNQE